MRSARVELRCSHICCHCNYLRQPSGNFAEAVCSTTDVCALCDANTGRNRTGRPPLWFLGVPRKMSRSRRKYILRAAPCISLRCSRKSVGL